MRLRQMFDSFAGDERSEYILRHADFDAICAARRANFSAILNGLPKELHGIRPVFPILTGAAVPSHFCLYAERRDEFQAFLAERQIRSTVYWPVGPMVHPEGHPSVTYIYADRGYIAGRTAPIIVDGVTDMSRYVNPIPAGLVLTGIVVSVSVSAVMLSLTVRIYKTYRTLDVDKLYMMISHKKKRRDRR